MKLSINQQTLVVLSTLLWNNEVYAFAPISSRVSTGVSVSKTAIAQSTIAKPVNGDTATATATATAGTITSDVKDASNPQAWDCDEEANCVQIDACDEEKCRTTLDVRIHGEWVDLSGKICSVDLCEQICPIQTNGLKNSPYHTIHNTQYTIYNIQYTDACDSFPNSE